ncbi:MAG TPA: hypothetical protein VMC81_09045 [Rhodocyclaceae bacterium]|nr:hypothetical protein [Rhodocyclaceae bacterium]
MVVVPVADCPQHLAAFVDSLLSLCRAYGYGGVEGGRWRKVQLLIAEDSADPAQVAGNRALAERATQAGLATLHFGPDEQAALLATLTDDECAQLAPMLGDCSPAYRGHKGQGATRNLAYLHLARSRDATRLLIWSVDSDQEFSVKIATADGDVVAPAISYFHRLDEIFARTDAQVLTGKVVGDPPVSPAVMAGNFLADVIAFLDATADGDPRSPCRHHERAAPREGEAAYHDMADLFGFRGAAEAWRYPCPLAGWHTEGDCFADFAARLSGFFHGEHPTRVSRYVPDDLWRTMQPARTVYAGNYVFRAESLARAGIAFAPLRLRMSGPTLGRLLKAQLGARFVSANLPMLHKRTVEGTSQAEFRPGVCERDAVVDLADEFERQFFGDVMLFTMERLTAQGYPARRTTEADFQSALDATRADLLARYGRRRVDIACKLVLLHQRLDDPTVWWSRVGHADALERFRRFADNIERNFGADAPVHARIASAEVWQQRRADLAQALERYPEDARAWADAVSRHA